MAPTEVSGKLIKDGSIQRRDLDITTTGESVLTKLVAGSGIALTSTGADPGTGEVTITAVSVQYQANDTWLKWRNSNDLFFLDNLKVDSSDNLVLNAESYLDNPETPGGDLSGSNILLQINKQTALSISSLAISAKQSLLLVPGSVGELSLAFNNDSDSGLCSLGADSLGLVTGGQTRVAINDSGLVGLSESSPEARLHVNPEVSSTTGILVKGVTSQSANLIEGQDASGNVVFAVSPSGQVTGTFSAIAIPDLAAVATSGDYTDLINKPDLILQSEKGSANGVATLNASGQIPSSQLPSYVDDVLEFASSAQFPASGETEKIYVAQDNNKIYRWSGSTYIEISPTAGLADSATKLATPRTISATGDATWSVSFDGSANASGALTLSNTGVASGTYTKVTVNQKGRVTSGTTLSSSDIPSLDASKITTGIFDTSQIPTGISITGNAASATKLATARNINGVSFDGTADITITANTTQSLTFGDGLITDSFNGSSAKTIAVNSTVVRTSGSQTIDGVKTFSSQISGSISGTSSNVTGTVAIANGGTGSTTAQTAINLLSQVSSATTGQVLTKNASGDATWATVNATSALMDGAAATPSLYFVSDTNSGLFRKGDDHIGFVVNGQTGLSLDGTSGVGRLAVGDIASVVSRLQLVDDNNNAASGITLGSNPATYVQMYKSGNNMLSINSHVDLGNKTITASDAEILNTVTVWGAVSAGSSITATGDLKTLSGVVINHSSPTIYFQDTNQRSAMIHVSDNTFYILRGSGTNSLGWSQYNNSWPLTINLENNQANFGGDIVTGNGVIASSVSISGNSGFSQNITVGADINIAGMITSTGTDVGITAENWLCKLSSSLRYKTNVEDVLPQYSERVLELRPIWYRANQETTAATRSDWSWFGLIAEEVAEVEPRLVNFEYAPEDIDPDTRKPKDGAQLRAESVVYSRISVLLLDVVKRQRDTIKSLEDRISRLEALVADKS